MKSMKVRSRPAIELNAMPSEPSQPEYPYGLRLCLEKDHVLMLGLAEAGVDEEFTILAKGKVCGVHKSENQRAEGENSYSHTVDIQITDMELEKK